jgi:hypothetical protein
MGLETYGTSGFGFSHFGSLNLKANFMQGIPTRQKFSTEIKIQCPRG